jgi:hypothetical protein
LPGIDWGTAELLDRLQNGTHKGKDGIKDIMQRGNLKDEGCFDRELWRKEIMSLG